MMWHGRKCLIGVTGSLVLGTLTFSIAWGAALKEGVEQLALQLPKSVPEGWLMDDRHHELS